MGAYVVSSPLDDGLPWKTDRSAPASCIFRGLLSVHSRFGLHARWITRCDPLHQRLRRTCCLLRRSDCYRLERPVAGWDLHPLEVAAFARRTIFGHHGVLGKWLSYFARDDRSRLGRLLLSSGGYQSRNRINDNPLDELRRSQKCLADNFELTLQIIMII
jgi:hypothetical protein